MKNLKKVLALVVVFAMMLSTVAFAGSFPDVADDADYASAIETLAAMGFFKGDDNGNFNPDATITRAEYAVIVCRLLGIEGSATGKCDFTDAADHWATGYIKMANQYGIVKGYGDGNFGPDDAVKYEEAVKMLVCALGYEPMATSKGGYPTGYIAVASQIGLLDGVSGAAQGTGAARNIVATMTYNALDIPVMEQTGFGTDISYEIMKKNDDHDKSTLLTKMGIYKLGGTILANSKVDYSGSNNKTDAGKIYFAMDDDYDCPESALAFKNDNQTVRNHTFEAGLTDAEDLVATSVILYVSKVSGKWTVQAAEIDGDNTNTLVIKAGDLNDTEKDLTKGDKAKPYIRYYKDGVTSGDGTKVNLNGNYVAAWNNNIADLTALTSDVSATVEFIDWDNDNKYDIVKVSEYMHLIADKVDEKKGTIETLQGTRIDLDINNDDAIVSIKDANGKALEISDIAKGDVLALLITSKDEKAVRPKLNYAKANYEALDIVVLKDSTVTGAVKEYDADGSDLTISVDGKDYDVATGDAGIYNKSKIDLQAEGTFYIGINGDIVGFEGDKLTSDNYGLILSAYTSSNKSTAPQVTIMTKEGKEVTYDFASSVRFVNPNTGKYIKENTKDKASSDLVSSLEKTTWKNVLSTSKEIRNSFNDIFTEELDHYKNDTTAVKSAEVAKRLITFKLNSNNEIVEVTPASTDKVTTEDVDFGIASTTAAKETYKANGQKLGKYLLADDAVIFDVDFDNPSSTKVSDVSYFVDDNDYTALLYNKDDDGYYGAVAIVDADAVFEDGAGLAIVESKRDTMVDDKEVTKVVAYKDGEKVELIFDDDEYTQKYSDVAPEDFAIGTVFMYTANAEGLVSKYAVVGQTTVASNNTKTFAFNAKFAKNYTADGDKVSVKDGDAFYLGYIMDKTSNDATVTVGVTDAVAGAGYKADKNGDQFTVSKANQYTVTGNAKNTSLSIGSYTYGDVDKYDADKDAAYYVLIRTYEDDEIDIISFDGKAQSKPAKLFVGTTTKPAEPVISYTATLEDKAYASVDDAVKAIVVTKTTDGKGETITEGFTVAPAVKDTEKSTATEEVYTVVITFADKTTKTLTFKVTVSAGTTEIKDEVKTAETVDEVAKVDDADL